MQQHQISKQNQEIFQTISELIVDSQFLLAQSEFFEKNCSKFENEEENKHEYQNIFQDYNKLLDFSMDQTLSKKYDQKCIQEFMEEFPKIYKNFKNQDCIEALFTFTDFDNFKKTMIEYKKIIDKKSQYSQTNNFKKEYTYDSEKIEQNMQKYYQKDISEWQIVYNSPSHKMYVTDYEDTGLDIYRNEGVLQNTSLQAIINITVNPPLQEYTKDSKQLHQAMFVEKFEGGNISYFQFSTPMINKRDMLVKTQIKYQNDICLISTHSVEMEDFPQVENITRAYVLKYIYYIPIENNQIKFVQIKYQDMKGYIPRMFSNMMMAKIMEDASNKLQVILEKEEKRIQEEKEVQEIK